MFSDIASFQLKSWQVAFITMEYLENDYLCQSLTHTAASGWAHPLGGWGWFLVCRWHTSGPQTEDPPRAEGQIKRLPPHHSDKENWSNSYHYNDHRYYIVKAT